MMRFTGALLAALLVCSPAAAKTFEQMFPQAARAATPEVRALLGGMDYQTGDVIVGNNLAMLRLLPGYYYLGPRDAKHVLTQLWGNPPDNATLGMVFPANKTPLDDTWGLEITYEAIGHVSDGDAVGYDYDSLLSTLRDDTAAENEWRKQNGYRTVSLVGWAERPRYDTALRALYWAKELAFEGDAAHGLNYNIRILGRRGVLVMNFIADMSKINAVRAAAPQVVGMTRFANGDRYSDYDPATDAAAAVGVGGLIAGKALVRAGTTLLALTLFKKFGFLLLVPIGFGIRFLFGGDE